ncbi:hypothetical protein SAMN04488135_1326 [Pollutimonas bauzanensis]|uniref:Uncharacterized protein n=1 Tax=Pollutimonas bauzanensis TaxID=658167 RepID=A0A1M6C2S0_9BURK|nr:hypothetical protein [Pollutimonas bauzanensis]SHI55111.1 hypothetical protein SAMN04488135_1326 [Pollutimonas bauzanensis]
MTLFVVANGTARIAQGFHVLSGFCRWGSQSVAQAFLEGHQFIAGKQSDIELTVERGPHPIYVESRDGLDGLAQANPVFDLAAEGTAEGIGTAPV